MYLFIGLLVFLLGYMFGAMFFGNTVVKNKKFRWDTKNYTIKEVLKEENTPPYITEGIIYSCPYDISCGCNMDEGCAGCIDFNADKYEV